MSGTVLGTEGHREKTWCCLPGPRGEWARQACQQCDWGCEEACIKVLWAHRGRVTHGPEELWVVQLDRLPESPFLDIPS